MTLSEKVAEIINLNLTIKDIYKRIDELEASAIAEAKVGEAIKLPNGKIATLVNNYAASNKAFKAVTIKLLEFKVLGEK